MKELELSRAIIRSVISATTACNCDTSSFLRCSLMLSTGNSSRASRASANSWIFSMTVLLVPDDRSGWGGDRCRC
jgi:hypothetical protein